MAAPAAPPPDKTIMVVELYGGRDITEPKTRNRKEGPALLDLYCTVKFGKQRFETPVVTHSMNPIWDSRFELDVTDTLTCAVITINCYHSGTIGRDFIGEVRLPLAEHQDVDISYAVQHWFPLFNPKTKKKDGSPGELGVKVGKIGGAKHKMSYDKTFEDRTVDDLYEEANTLATEANESVHRSLRLVEQTREIGSSTLNKLQNQGELIQRLQGDIDSVENNMIQSERRLRSIESVWGTVANKITSGGNARLKKKAENDRKLLKKRQKQDKQLQALREDQWSERRAADLANSTVRRDKMLVRDPGTRVEAGSSEDRFLRTTDDTDHALDRIGDVLDDLKIMALDMGNHINHQNQGLASIQKDLDKLNPRINSAIRRAKDIVN